MEKGITTNLKSLTDSPNGGPSPSAATFGSRADDLAALAALVSRSRGLLLFGGVLADEIGECFIHLLAELSAPEPDAGELRVSYARLFSLLAAEAELSESPLVGDAWQNHLLERLVADSNPFSLKAERAEFDAMGPSLIEASRSDMATLEELFRLDGSRVLEMVRARLGDGAAGLVSWDSLRPIDSPSGDNNGELSPAVKELLGEGSGWPRLLPRLAEHYASAGSGVFARYRAFRWTQEAGEGVLQGVAHPDTIHLDNLVEYELERALLLRNTEQFVAGYPANNVLLYGDRGTGKSSTIKALLHQYGERGLRLIEIPKSLLGDLPRILALLRGRKERFILFVDDLSFDEQETAYKELKAALEGSVEARPENVVVYATSNRRHLVQERFSDRMGGDAEVRSYDTHQEKLSLSDRFGITLVFSTPDQPRYLRIVESLARQKGMEVEDPELRSEAVRWAAQQGGFSGRTARQFVDYLAGQKLAGPLTHSAR